jgi:hypothetical protein
MAWRKHLELRPEIIEIISADPAQAIFDHAKKKPVFMLF